MPNQLTTRLLYVRARWDASGGWDEAGSVVEKVILTAVFAGLAILVGAVITAKVLDKANTINLN